MPLGGNGGVSERPGGVSGLFVAVVENKDDGMTEQGALTHIRRSQDYLQKIRTELEESGDHRTSLALLAIWYELNLAEQCLDKSS